MADLKLEENLNPKVVKQSILVKEYAEDVGDINSDRVLSQSDFANQFNYVQQFASQEVLIHEDVLEIGTLASPSVIYHLRPQVLDLVSHIDSFSYGQISPFSISGSSIYNFIRATPVYRVVVYGYQHFLGELFVTDFPFTPYQWIKFSQKRIGGQPYDDPRIFTEAIRAYAWAMAMNRKILRMDISRETTSTVESSWIYTLPYCPKNSNMELGSIVVGTVTGLHHQSTSNGRLKLQVYRSFKDVSYAGFTANITDNDTKTSRTTATSVGTT